MRLDGVALGGFWRSQNAGRGASTATATAASNQFSSQSKFVIKVTKTINHMKKSVLFLALIVLGVTSQSLLAGAPGGPGGSAPDGGTTAALLTVGVGGLAWVRKYFRR